MQIREDREQGAVIVTPEGRIDSITSGALDRHLLALGKAGERRVIVDLAGVDYISSAGLRVMLTLAKRTRESGGALALCALGASVRQVFELAGFLGLFTIEPARADAIRRVAVP